MSDSLTFSGVLPGSPPVIHISDSLSGILSDISSEVLFGCFLVLYLTLTLILPFFPAFRPDTDSGILSESLHNRQSIGHFI